MNYNQYTGLQAFVPVQQVHQYISKSTLAGALVLLATTTLIMSLLLIVPAFLSLTRLPLWVNFSILLAIINSAVLASKHIEIPSYENVDIEAILWIAYERYFYEICKCANYAYAVSGIDPSLIHLV